jgi:hypothetical protein
MPTEQRPWRDQPGVAQRARQVKGCGCEKGSIRRSELRPRNLAAQNLEFVPQHEQLDVLRVQAVPTPDERAEQSPERKVEEEEDHAADPPRPPRSDAT